MVPSLTSKKAASENSHMEINYISKIQLVVYYQYCVLIG